MKTFQKHLPIITPLYFLLLAGSSLYEHNIMAAGGWLAACAFSAMFWWEKRVNISMDDAIQLHQDVEDCNKACAVLKGQMIHIYNLGVEMERYAEFNEPYYEFKKRVEELIILPNINIDDLNKKD